MRRTRSAVVALAGLLPVLAAGGCAADKALAPTGPRSTAAGGSNAAGGKATAGGNNALHNDKFPCVASQAEVAGVTGQKVDYDSVEPDGRSCVYRLANGAFASSYLKITVIDGFDRNEWHQANQVYPSWSSGGRMGGRSVDGMGDEAFLSRIGYDGQLDILKGSRLVRVAMNVRHRLSDAEFDGLIRFGRTVVARL